MDRHALEDLKCSVLRHAVFLSELYILFQAGCDSLFKHRWKHSTLHTSVIGMEEAFISVCPHNKAKRYTFIAGLIKAALSEHMPTSKSGTFDNGRDNVPVSVDASAYFVRLVEHLRRKHISTYSKLMKRNHRVFRWKHLYTESTMAALHGNHSKLRALFSFFADGISERISLESWLAFTRIMQMQVPLESTKCVASEVYFNLLFKWSCHTGENTLDFSGWSELMARLSLRLAMPTEKDILSTRKSTFLWFDRLRMQGGLRQWEQEHRIEWGSKAETGQVAQLLPRLLEYSDCKLRVARNIQHFLAKRFRKWNPLNAPDELI